MQPKIINWSSTKAHIQTVHNSTQDVIKCPQCDQEFTRKDKLTRHNKEIHRVANVNHHYSENNCIDQRAHYIRPYQCIDCGVKFKRNYDLERHRRMTHEKKEVLKFPLAPMGVLAPVSAHARHSAQPPIDTSGNFPAHVSAESPSNISPNPSEVISKVSELYNTSF